MRFLIIFIVSVFWSCSGFATEFPDYRFHKMPETSYYAGIHSIAKDSIGRMWFSGYDALYMYDGSSYKQMNDLVTRFSPMSYWTYGQVIVDKQRQLYVATNLGLLRFNYKKQKFERVLEGNVGTISCVDDGSIWLIRDNNVESFNPSNPTKTVNHSLTIKFPVSWLICNEKHIYFSSKKTLYKYNSHTKKFIAFTQLGNINSDIKDAVEYNGNTYVLTEKDGIYRCDAKGNIIHHFNLDFGYGKSTNAKKLYLDKWNNIWAATQSGLFIVSPETSKTLLLRANSHQAYSLPNNSVWSIYEDPDAGVWLGTYGGKLAYLPFSDNDVNYLKFTQGGLNHPIVSCFEEDNKGNLWIGTEGGGLNYWNRQTDKISYLTRDDNNGLTSNLIKNLRFDKQKNILQISTFNGGMVALNTGNRTFNDLSINHPVTGQPLSIYDSAPEGNQGMWITNPDAELIYRDNRTGKTEIVKFKDKTGKILKLHVETLFRGKLNKLWLITQDGLYIADVTTRTVTKHLVIKDAPYPANNLNSYLIASDSVYWFGTHGGGINRLDKKGNYINFSEKDGLYGKTIFGILEDNSSKDIWFSTNDGLYYYDYKSKKINKSYINNLELCGAFYVRSCFKTSNGEMLFGGTDGFIIFTPSKIKKNPQPPKVYFTDLLINNKRATPQTSGAPLKQDIATLSYNNNNTIALSHKESNIEIRISSNSYLQAEKNQYAYRMVGLSNQWYFLPAGQKSVQFYNLPAGDYTFEIKAANNDGLWGKDISKLYFRVHPSPFLSVWAYIIYALFILGLVILVWRYFTNKKIFEHRLAMEQLKEHNMRQLVQARVNFFTNISHDLKTPLTLIIDPLKKLKELLPAEQSQYANSYVNLIEKNVSRIQRMISQLLQFREIESQKITINTQPGDLIPYIYGIFSLFEDYAQKKNIDTHITTDIENFYTEFDHDIIDKILTNLLSNAINYSGENEQVFLDIKEITGLNSSSALSLKNELRYISVSITNTGVEIPEDKREVIFESFNRLISGKPAFEKGTGLGLSIVKELVEHSNGRIILDSSDMKVTFTVIIPFTTIVTKIPLEGSKPFVNEVKNIFIDSKKPEIKNNHSRKAHSVVVIEDDPNLRDYITQRLSEYYNVYTANNGSEGIALAGKIFPQVVVSDLMMPEANGFEVCRQLRENVKTSHIPIVVISALGENTDNKIKALESGANVFISKPFDLDFLVTQISNLIKSQNELKELYSKKYIVEPSKITISSTDEDLLNRAMKFMEKNISNLDYNVDHFVADMGIGRTLLYQKFNDILGMSIKEFIMDMRLKRAAQLLEQSELTISEISYMTGFKNPKHFSTCFKKQYEVTPTQFKEKN